MTSTLAPGTRRFLELLKHPVSAREITQQLVPPPHFADAQFGNYEIDGAYPSQSTAKERVEEFAARSGRRSGLVGRLLGRATSEARGLYLDGGFGVGKTHLLASAFHRFDGPKAFLSFQELMFLVGLESLDQLIRDFSPLGLLAIDEFELDDPANTRIAFRILTQLLPAGVRIITTSNTPPGALGDGKFSREDFARELGEIGRKFDVVMLDGEDFRATHQRAGAGANWTIDPERFRSATRQIAESPKTISMEFKDLLRTLSSVHPMRVRNALPNFSYIVLDKVTPIEHPHEALQFVYCIDKAYDNDVSIVAHAEIEVEEIFHSQVVKGGDTKKYRRAISRLHELT